MYILTITGGIISAPIICDSLADAKARMKRTIMLGATTPETMFTIYNVAKGSYHKYNSMGICYMEV